MNGASCSSWRWYVLAGRSRSQVDDRFDERRVLADLNQFLVAPSDWAYDQSGHSVGGVAG